MILKEIPYYIGLDCGTNSVGFAVTDKEYNLVKAQHKDMWGSHLFDEADTAEARRIQRNARKRLHRRNERIKLLQSLFAEEIAKIDPTFFLRLNESGFLEEDRSTNNKQAFSLFNDKDYTDKDFKKDFPTIYHLRAGLIDDTVKHDPRFVYLALHHIIKNRGHFLFPGEDMASVQDIGNILKALQESYETIFEEEFNFDNQGKKIEQALRMPKKAERIDTLSALFFTEDDKRKRILAKIIAGHSIQLKTLFDNDEYEDLPKLEFQKNSFEEQDLPILEERLTGDEYKLVESLKALYDWSLLSNIMAGQESISKAKVKQYDKNKNDIKLLKKVIQRYCPEEYEIFFHSDKEGSFSNYIGSINTSKNIGKNKKEKHKRVKRSNVDSFYKAIQNLLKNADENDQDVKSIKDDISNDNFYSLLRSYRNGVVPFQVNLAELKLILDKAKNYMTWLNIKDKDNLTPCEKIIKIMKFRIPYYVGPLVSSDKNPNAWMVRNEAGRIFPWNFNKKINESDSAENFITRMTNKCTYLPEEDVVPKQSLLYQSFMVLNEINNLKFNGEDITVEQKQMIYNSLFKNGNVTQAKIKKLARTQGWIRNDEMLELSGIDTTIKSSLSSYIAFKDYLESNKLSNNDVEKIIRLLTLFSEGGNIVKDKIKTEFQNKLTENEIEKISRMKFSGWGNLSRKFLTGIEAINPETGEYENIIRLLWDTNYNLMEIIYHKDSEVLEKISNQEPINNLEYELLDNLRISPKVKRQIWQTLKIVKEIQHIMGHNPEKIFIEVARYEGEKGKRTKTRKDSLLESYRKLKNHEDEEILKSLEKEDSSLITKRDRLYLYYTQRGKCMYSGEPIDLYDLLNNNKNFDIDHIYPYSKSNDDSLANKVIVKSKLNREKSNTFPISEDIRLKMTPFWKKLLNDNLISSEKYHRLTRNTPLSPDDLQGFINRQIVETSQSTVALADILKKYFGQETKIVYSKAGNVSDFRKDYELPKARSINHLHHAKDAYLNIVVGNTLNTKYTDKWFLKNVNFNNPFKSNVEGAWIADNDKTVSLVKSTMNKNSVLFTRQQEMRTGQLFDLNPKVKGSEKGMIPLKMTEKLREELKNSSDKEATIKAWTDKYGGYNSIAISHFALVRHLNKKNYVYTFIKIPIIRAKELLKEENLLKYCTEELGYKDVTITRKKVLFNTLLSVDGFLMTISNSRDKGASLGLESAIPLFLKNEDTKYIKKLEKFTEKKKLNKNLLIDEKYDEINKERNIILYEFLLKKSKLFIFKNRPGNSSAIIENGMNVFIDLPIEQQVQALMSILNYLGMNSGRTDFSLIGGGTANGTLTISSTIDPSKKKVSIIDQSITGIYEEKTELK